MKPAAQWSSCIYSFTQTDLFFLVSFVVSFIAGAATADGIETVSPFVSSTLVAVCETLKIGGVTPRFSSAVEGCLNALIDSDPTCTHALAIGKVVCELASAGGASCEAALRVIPKWLVAAARDDSAFAAVRPILAQIARDFQRSRRLLALVSAVAEVRRCTRLSYLSESLGTSSSSCWISRTHARAQRSLMSSTCYTSLCSPACQLDMVLVLTNQQQRAPSSSLLRCVCKQQQRATRQPLTFLRRTSLGPSRCSARLSRRSHQTTTASSRIFAFLRAFQTQRTR
jgi:hypothetical protein